MLIGTYLVYATVMVLAHPQFLYPFADASFDQPGFAVTTAGSRDVPVTLSEGSGEVAVLYFMGNAGALAYFVAPLQMHQDADRTVAAMQYRGGGGVAGAPSEAVLKADALVAFDWLAARHDGPIVVHGFSMGTGLAVHVAARRDVAAVILDAPYMRMCELMARASLLPACQLPSVQRWDTAADLTLVTAPVLVQAGDADDVIPPDNSRAIAKALRDNNTPVTLQIVEGAGHNDLMFAEGYAARISAFLAEVAAK